MYGMKSYCLGAVLAGVSLMSCGGGANGVSTGVVSGKEGYMPYIPDSVTSPKGRGEYAAVHYWDAYDFSHTPSGGDSLLLEQAFSNYISLLAMSDGEVRTVAVDSFLNKATKDSKVYDVVDALAERYLDDPSSPFRNEDLYIIFLRYAVASREVTEAVRERCGYKLGQAMKNRPGMQTADFPVLTSDGRKIRFRDTFSGDTTLVMFYDPDCDHCKEISVKLSQTPLPATLKIWAIDVAGNRRLWEVTKGVFPSDWNVGFATVSLEDESLYHFPALPSLYIYAPDGKILLKDFDISDIM